MSEKKQTPPQQQKRGGPMGGPMGGMGGAGQKAQNFKDSMGKLIKYLRQHYLTILLALAFTAVGTVLAILAPSQVEKLTNHLWKTLPPEFASVNMRYVARICTILLVYYILHIVFNFIQAYIMAGVTQRVSTKLRRDISKKINLVPLSYFDSRTVGDTLSVVTNDVDTIGQTLSQSVSAFLWAIMTIIGVLIAMFITSWQLALTAMVTVPISFILMAVTMKFSQKYFVAQQVELGALNGQIEEVYSGQTVVKAFNGQIKAQEAFNRTNKKLFKSAKTAQFLSGTMMPLMGFVSNLSYVAICIVGGILCVKGKIDAGVITAFFLYVRLFQNPFGQLAQAANQLQSTAAAAERVFNFLDVKEQEDESVKEKQLETIRGKVEFKNVRFGYTPEKTIIHDFSAIIKPGQKVAIVGPTGAGKTTLVNLLMRFYEVQGGQILIDDVPISHMKREEVRAMFGMVLQDTWLFNGTMRENIIYAEQNVTEEQIVTAGKAANVDHFIRTLPGGYDMILDDQASISSGQRQLLTIARAMVQNTPMLILDEATSSVDTRTEQLIQDAMDKLTKDRTSFVIAHRLSTIKNADLILVMNNGDIVEKGKHNELIKNKKGFYAQLYNSQFEEV